MKTAGGRKPKPLGHSAQQPSEWRGRSEQISLDQVGCEARKLPALGEISFLTSSFIEQISLDQVGCEARKLPALGEISFLTSSFIELLVTYLHWERLSKLTILRGPGDAGSLPDGTLP